MRLDAFRFVIKMHEDGLTRRAQAVRNPERTPQPNGEPLRFELHRSASSQMAATLIAPISRNEDTTTNSGTFDPSELRSDE